MTFVSFLLLIRISRKKTKELARKEVLSDRLIKNEI